MPSIVSIVGVSVQELPDIYKYFYGEQAQEAKSSGSGIIVSQNDTELLLSLNCNDSAGLFVRDCEEMEPLQFRDR